MAPDLESRLDRFIAVFAALVCFFFATTLRDLKLRDLPPATLPAPPVPASLERDAELSVLLVDENDRPVPGASVRVFSIQAAAPGTGPATTAYFAGDRTADADGRARFEALPRGEAWVLGYAAGRARASTRVVLEKGSRDARLVLRVAAALDVVVVDESDKPVEGAEIRVTTGDPLPYVVMTAAAGTARLDRLGPAPWVVRASAPGFEEVTRTSVMPGPPIRIRLEKLGALEVTVVGGDGKPVIGATVLAAGSGLWPARTATADGAGQARIAGLRGGVYDLKARAGDLVSKTEIGVPLKRGEVKQVRLTLEAGRQVRVVVTDGDPSPDGPEPPPIKDASVVLVEEGISSFPLQGRTNERGIVVLGPIASVRATVSARAPGFVPRSAVPVAEGATEVHVGLLRGGVLAGDVVDDRGYPVDGATIEVVGTDGDGMPIDETTALTEFREEHFASALSGPAPLIPVGELGVMPGPIPDLPREGFSGLAAPGGGGDPWVTRADGTFRAEPVSPGRVHAIVRHPGYVEGVSDTVTIRPGGTATVHIVLRQGGALEGRVVEEDKTPVAGARVELAATQGSLERVTYTADDGTFAFAAVPSEVLVSVARPETPGDIAVRMVVQVPERDRREIEIVLPKLRDAVSLHVTDSRGYPLGRVEARCISLDVDVPLRRTLFTNDDGDAELPDAVGLPLRITLLRPSKSPRVEQVDPAPRHLTLAMNEGVTARGTVTGRGGRERLDGAELTLYTSAGARHARSDAEGGFAIEDLGAGRARLVAHHEGFAPAEKLVVIGGDSDRPADVGEIDLLEAGEVSGVVVDPQDEPVPGARVARDAVPTYLPLGPLPAGVVATDRDGRFTLGGLPEGDVTLEAYFADLGRGFVEAVPVQAGRTTTRIKIALQGDAGAKAEPKGAGSVAVTLGQTAKTVVVVMVPPGSEAEIGGIEPGDELLTINGREVHSIEEARRRLTGPLGEDVVVALSRQDVQDGRLTWLARVRRERVRR